MHTITNDGPLSAKSDPLLNLLATALDIAAVGYYAIYLGPRVTYLERLLEKEPLYAYTLPCTCSKPHPNLELFKL